MPERKVSRKYELRITKDEMGMFKLDDCWDAAVIDFCRTRYPLALEPILVSTSTNELNDIYAIVPPDELHKARAWYDLTAIYECGVVKHYTVMVEDQVCNYVHYQRFIWRDPNTKVFFMPKEEIRDDS